MRFFFKSRQFKVILAVFCIVLVLSVGFGVVGKRMAPHTDIAGTISAPFKSLANIISDGISNFFAAHTDHNELMLENAELTGELNEMREKVADYDRISAENEEYKKYLELKEAHPDFQFAKGTLISRDSADPYGCFTVNCGSASGVSLHDPVITEAGLVGYVTEVGSTTCKITTILSPEVVLGALDNRTADSGIVSGNISLAKENKCRFSNLPRNCGVAIGDYVVTSGEGIFPQGLLIGTIDSIGSDKYNTSIYADITPFADLSTIKEVMVITYFDGQGGINPEEKGK